MPTQLEQRLQELKSEYDAGQKTLSDLKTKEASLRETLKRIPGAIELLKQELTSDRAETKVAAHR